MPVLSGRTVQTENSERRFGIERNVYRSVNRWSIELAIVLNSDGHRGCFYQIWLLWTLRLIGYRQRKTFKKKKKKKDIYNVFGSDYVKNVDVAFEFFLGKLCHYCVYVVSECAFFFFYVCMYGTTTTVALVIMLLYYYYYLLKCFMYSRCFICFVFVHRLVYISFKNSNHKHCFCTLKK